MSNVIDKIVRNNLCIGCGVCAGICPQQSLIMDFNIYGEYNPLWKQQCSLDCGLCMGVCPFSDEQVNETDFGHELFGSIDGIKFSEETGYYLNSFVGHSPAFRETSASGGIATWLLTTLLENDIVDYVICVATNNDPERLFSFQIFEDAKLIIQSSGSAYYPVELSDIIKIILDQPGRYVITGLPCFIKAIRFAASGNKKLSDRITFTVGLVCGQTKSKHYTAYLSELAKAGGALKKVKYRGKSTDKPASNFYFHCINHEGIEGKLFWKTEVSEAWINRWFTPNACNFCDDIFAELADITLMDAWLPEYIQDSEGTNLVIVRSQYIYDILVKNHEEKKLEISTIPINKVVQSQAGVVDIKRAQLSYRLYLAKKDSSKVPFSRIKSNNKIGFLKIWDIRTKNEMQLLSKDLFLLGTQDNLSRCYFLKKEMRTYLLSAKIQKMITLIFNLFHLIYRK